MISRSGAPVRASLLRGAAFQPWLILLCLAGSAWAAGATPTANCLPIPTDGAKTVEINTSGIYCLKEDLAWDQPGVAVRIFGENITLDLNGHAINGRDETLNQIGILVDEKSEKVSIENGAIKSMQVGIRASDVSNLTIQNLDFQWISWFGVHVSGIGNVIVDSTFSDIGYLYDGESGDAYSVAILAGGKNMTIRRNEFKNVLRQPVDQSWVGEGVSILISEDSEKFSVEENLFFNDSGKSRNTIGLWARVRHMKLMDNDFNNVERPVEGAYEGIVRVRGNKFVSNKSQKIKKWGDESDALKTYPAVAMRFSKNTSGVFIKNEFIGYSCPVILSGEVFGVATKFNKVDWRGGALFCEGVGRWQSGFVFRPPAVPKLHPKNVNTQ